MTTKEKYDRWVREKSCLVCATSYDGGIHCDYGPFCRKRRDWKKMDYIEFIMHDLRRERKRLEEELKMIKDSGERTAFETGAVRDMHAGKGRMDLLPWRGIMEVSKLCEEGAIKYGERNVDKGIPLHSLLDSGARHLAKYINGENDEDHLRSAAWNLLWALEQRVTHPELNDMPWSGDHDGVS